MLIAFLVAAGGKWPDGALSRFLTSIHFAAKKFTWLEGMPAITGGILIVVAICLLLVRAGRSAEKPDTTPE